ncbi:CCCH zinc finger protein [Penicillium brevicompactum]|uniref:CCCH zinc finger protein n=1 Tax=Penicillium brevicompactum TaxID=5074 RepID=A0A9W9U9W1_PENBR|nr:CCCH zinc finger protein [Penicillium brevicompactum]
MTENEDLLAKIGQLAGQINRHRSQDTQQTNHQSQYVSRHAPSHQGWSPYYRGRGRGRGRGAPAPHRHRTLVLNNTASGSNSGVSASTTPTSAHEGPTPTPATSTGNGWIAKRDRHMQLINSSVYEKETLARSKAMEETRKIREQRKAEREQAKVLRYAQGPGGVATVSTPAHPTAGHEIMVNDVAFRVARGGSKLMRISSAYLPFALSSHRISLPFVDDPNTANNTPKRVTIAGVPFVRSKNGNLHRLGAVASKKHVTTKKRDELCKRFTTTGTCYKGPTCLFTHDPIKVAICKDFLQTGQCAAGSSCDLSHEPSPHRSPACMHFLRGRCANPECRYAHVRVTPGAPVCRAFATLGYCDKGDACEEKHVHECPDYANTGACNKKRCQLPHVDRAGQIRKAAAAAAAADQGEDESDASSEEETYDAIDSDDVDSDAFDDCPEELVEGMDSGEMSQQQDFIAL